MNRVNKKIIITGERVNLRAIEQNDLSAMVKWRNKENIRVNFFSQDIISAEMQITWFKSYMENMLDLTFMIETKDGFPIGTVALYKIDFDNHTAEFGRLLIGEDSHVSKGYARASVELLIEYAFKELNLTEIYLEVFADNFRGVSIYERCGFKTTQIRESNFLGSEGHKRNILRMSLLRSEYFA